MASMRVLALQPPQARAVVAPVGASRSVKGLGRAAVMPARLMSTQEQRPQVLARAKEQEHLENSAVNSLRPLATAALVAAASFGLAAAAEAAGVGQESVKDLEEELTSSFAVDLMGYSVDHKDLIYGVFVGQWVALIGAAVGGWTARTRAAEVEALNAKMLDANRRMRSMRNREVHGTRMTEPTEAQEQVVQCLREGKRLLKEKKAEEARTAFERALVCISAAGNELDSPWRAERKARRGLGAAANQLQDYEDAEKNLLRVIELCETMLSPGEDRPELADAYGVIADMYTEWGKLDSAAKYYDAMIGEMAV